ncbi:hypothetical protein S144_35 [Shewanella sp. phage 1/44]|uniref:hypothetical protein n=1 Tax=Shewanella sp. phage 1/44 TaxID=1458862 RepID=UPI0004F827BD|nr:hypothetical protein S144_35 [Shewanella sp. phage 1/44]AHK11749.1 hypothetical protein S144_35 [Shewanella sp. phage 1/44]
MADKKELVSVVLDHDDLWIDDKHYVGKKGESIEVSPRNAKMMELHNFIKKQDGKA